MTVEEVARLASRYGWSYEALMSMTLPERRLWLAAAGTRDAAGTGAAATRPVAPPVAGVPAPTAEAAGANRVTPASGPAPAAPAEPRLTTEEERRARLYQLLQDFRREREQA